MFGFLARSAMSEAVVRCVRAMTTVVASFVPRLFHTRLLGVVFSSVVRLYEVELRLLCCVWGAARCDESWSDDENGSCLRSWDGSCGEDECDGSDICWLQLPVCVHFFLWDSHLDSHNDLLDHATRGTLKLNGFLICEGK